METNTKIVEFGVEELAIYRKKKISVHYIETLDIADDGKIIDVPTLEGIVKVKASRDQYIIVGPCNDIYPIPRKLFESKYETSGEVLDDDIAEQIRNLGWNHESLKKCRLSKDSFIYAKEVPYDFSVFVKHCNSFIYGKAGDFYAITFEEPENRYIIDSHVMKETYELINQNKQFVEEIS